MSAGEMFFTQKTWNHLAKVLQATNCVGSMSVSQMFFDQNYMEMLRRNFISTHGVNLMPFGQMTGPELCHPNIVSAKMSVGQLFFLSKRHWTIPVSTKHCISQNVCGTTVFCPKDMEVFGKSVTSHKLCLLDFCQPNVFWPKWHGNVETKLY